MQDSSELVAAFEARVGRRIAQRCGRAAADLLLRDPLGRYAAAFIRDAGGVHAEHVAAAYAKPLSVLAAMVAGGTVTSFAGLIDMMARVVAVTARHYAVKSRRKWDPWVRVAGGRPGESMPLVRVTDADLDRRVARTAAPPPAAARADLLRLLLREARGLGRLRVRVFREVRAAACRRGTDHGAIREVARLAVLDGGGRVVGVARAGPALPAGPGPAAATVRRVRRLYLEAEWYVECRAYLLGYRAKSPF